MGVRISDMDRFSGIMDDADLMEMTRINEKKTYAVSAQVMAEYFKSQNNGGFRGSTDKSLDAFTYADTGVYYWSGDPAKSGMPAQGLLEVFCPVKPSASNYTNVFLTQRLTFGNEVYTRSSNSGDGKNWSDWSVLSNKNGAIVFSGNSTDSSINFKTEVGGERTPFTKIPTVVVTPVAGSGCVNIINVGVVDQNGFTVVRYTSALEAVETTTTGEETKTESSGSTTTHTTNTTKTTRGAWTEADFAYQWIAIQDG